MTLAAEQLVVPPSPLLDDPVDAVLLELLPPPEPTVEPPPESAVEPPPELPGVPDEAPTVDPPPDAPAVAAPLGAP
jgi:hypothetical protein